MRQIAEEVYGKYDVKMVETMEYHYGSFVSVFDGERFLKENEVSQEDMMEVCQVYLIRWKIIIRWRECRYRLRRMRCWCMYLMKMKEHSG